ncbi:MAG: acyl-CoA dehydrogenase family protein [Salinirussus sp.]
MSEFIGLADRHADLRDEIRRFAEAALEPAIDHYEDSGRFPRDIIEDLAAEGYFGASYPPAYGGRDVDMRSMAVIQEELSRVWKLPAGVMNVASTLVGHPIREHGDEWQREEWLGAMFSNGSVGALSMTEPDAGSDASAISTTARRDGDEWVIDGHKHWTSYGHVAGLLLVLARTGDERHDLSLIGVPMDPPGERDGVEFVRDQETMAGSAGVESEIRYDGCRVPADHLVGERDAGFEYIMRALDLGRINTAAQGIGVAQGAFEAARSFAGEREQFGRPIHEFQGVGFKLADMRMDIQGARLLTYQAAADEDGGGVEPATAAMAKTRATDVAMDVTTEAVQVHGARGYSTDYPVERYMREAKGMQIYEGTNEINRQVIVNGLY